MNDLIQISKTQIDGIEVNSVNSREVYRYLEVGSQYSNWIQRAIDKYEFEEGIDFNIFVKPNNNQKDYIVTIDMAKELCMVTNTPKGKEVRKYFIQVEKQNTTNSLQLPQNYIEALKALTIAEEQKQRLSETIKAKDEIILVTADLNIKAGHVSFSDFSKNLALENMGRNNVIKFCKAKGILMGNTEPYQPYIKRGYFVRKPSKEKINGEVRYKTMLTPRGTVWLARVIKAEYEID